MDNNGKRAMQEDRNGGASCQRVDVDLGAVGDTELEFPGGAVMSLHITPEERLSGNAGSCTYAGAGGSEAILTSGSVNGTLFAQGRYLNDVCSGRGERGTPKADESTRLHL